METGDLGFYILFPAAAWLAASYVVGSRGMKEGGEEPEPPGPSTYLRSHELELSDHKDGTVDKERLVRRRFLSLESVHNTNFYGKGDRPPIF